MSKESWATRVGVILAVTGSAVGLGNFLRFPGLAAQYEGGVFMIPYFIAFILVGLPIAWVEWTMGRYGGTRGYNSMPGIFRVICKRKGVAPYLGVFGLIVPVIIYMYYVYIEAWCLGFAISFLTGQLNRGDDPQSYTSFFNNFVGMGHDGAVFSSPFTHSVLPFLLICVILNFYLIWRGLSKGIEKFCQIALPLLLVIGLVVLVRVLTLDNVAGGLGMTWNPTVNVQSLAAGDKSLEGFVAADEARRMLAGEVQIDDVPAFEKDLASHGWTRPAPAAGDTPASVPWRHADGELGLTVNRDGHVQFFHKVSKQQVKLAAWAPIASFGELAPEDLPVLLLIHSNDLEAVTVEQLVAGQASLPDGPAFSQVAELSGWRPLKNGDVHGLWVHDGSKLRIDWINDAKHVVVVQRSFIERLANADMWLAAASQIFFTLSVGFGVIIVYSSYMRRDDDVALSGLTAASGNGFAEVCLGGMITIPAAFAILGASGVNAAGASLFNLGFMTLPNVFANMFMGQLFGFLFFFLLFLAAVTSSLSMLQPAIAFLEEAMGIGRHASVAILGLITIMGTFFIVYFSHNAMALDTLDYWITNLCMVVLAFIQVVLFAWVLGIEKGMAELRNGAEIRLPPGLGFVIKYVSPVFLAVLFGWWGWQNFIQPMLGGADLPPRIAVLTHNTAAQMSVGLLVLLVLFFILLIGEGKRRWAKREASGELQAEIEEATS